MSVYFIRSGDRIKIGYSNDVQRRVQAVRGSLHTDSEYLGYMAGDRKVEGHLHRRFAASREFGEWFKVSDELLEVVELLANTGYPSDESITGPERLQAQEERYAEEASYFIRQCIQFISALDDPFAALADTCGIAASRLRAIYDGQVCPITAGEYVVLHMAAEIDALPRSEEPEAETKTADLFPEE